MKTIAKCLTALSIVALLTSCRYGHGEPSDPEGTPAQTEAQRQSGGAQQPATTESEPIPQDSTRSSNPQGNVKPRE